MAAKCLITVCVGLAGFLVTATLAKAQNEVGPPPRKVETQPSQKACAPLSQDVCKPTPNIRVIVPEPEVVFHYAQPSGTCGAPCSSGGGQIAFNMNLNVPMGGLTNLFAAQGLSTLLGGQPLGSLSSGNSGLESQLVRAMAARLSANSADTGNPAISADLEAQFRRLESGINALNARIDEDRTKSNQQLLQSLQELERVAAQYKDINDRLRKLESRPNSR